MTEKLVALFNPLRDAFSYEWKDDKNEPHTLTLEGREITYLPDYQAHFMAKHLSDAIYNEQGRKVNPEVDIKEILKQIYVNI